MKENFDKWIKFLNPENLKDNLTFCSLYIMFYETTKDYVIDQVKDFYMIGYDKEQGYITDKKYKKEVLSKERNVLNASLLWFKDADAISYTDIEIFSDIRKYRNILAHEMLDKIFEGLDENFIQRFVELINFRINLERWWIINIDVPTSDINKKIEEDQIISSSQILYRMIMDIISGNENSEYYYNEFIKYKENSL